MFFIIVYYFTFSFFFQVDEDIVREHFSKFGVIDEINLLRKKDGQLVGCGFIQFRSRSEALRAIEECNMKPLLGEYFSVFQF